ncbi:MAG TPA: hypothetical protein V6D48_19640 [Oculatellaceae cyanobacterium]
MSIKKKTIKDDDKYKANFSANYPLKWHRSIASATVTNATNIYYAETGHYSQRGQERIE